MQPSSAYTNSSCRIMWRPRLLRCALLLIACSSPAFAVYGQGVAPSPSTNAPQGVLAGPLSIQVHDDRLTLTVAKAPQVYLFGMIDADAPRRVQALIQSRKIPPGSDIYLDSPGGDMAAGFALGRLFRAGSMATHLGAPKLPRGAGVIPRTAMCTDACAYAYFGGLYRWAPAGGDRFGLHALDAADPHANNDGKAAQASGDAVAYLKDMGIQPAIFRSTPTAPHDDTVWLSADQMISTGLANNGYLPITTTSELSSGAPTLVLDEIVRGTENRITFVCRPNELTLTSYRMVGLDRARQIVAHGIRPHFEIDQQEIPTQQSVGASVSNEGVVISGPYSPTHLARLLTARTIGTWIVDRNNALRYGFVIVLDPVRKTVRDYSARCEQIWQQSGTSRP